mmetsp:Transcript_46248/g.132410  ORF Transcript_46248/g.132410 Transcript_46248/m.132410 type:complete len:501 (-) Transcript_46248:1658-3160(-)
MLAAILDDLQDVDHIMAEVLDHLLHLCDLVFVLVAPRHQLRFVQHDRVLLNFERFMHDVCRLGVPGLPPLAVQRCLAPQIRIELHLLVELLDDGAHLFEGGRRILCHATGGRLEGQDQLGCLAQDALGHIDDFLDQFKLVIDDLRHPFLQEDLRGIELEGMLLLEAEVQIHGHFCHAFLHLGLQSLHAVSGDDVLKGLTKDRGIYVVEVQTADQKLPLCDFVLDRLVKGFGSVHRVRVNHLLHRDIQIWHASEQGLLDHFWLVLLPSASYVVQHSAGLLRRRHDVRADLRNVLAQPRVDLHDCIDELFNLMASSIDALNPDTLEVDVWDGPELVRLSDLDVVDFVRDACLDDLLSLALLVCLCFDLPLLPGLVLPVFLVVPALLRTRELLSDDALHLAIDVLRGLFLELPLSLPPQSPGILPLLLQQQVPLPPDFLLPDHELATDQGHAEHDGGNIENRLGIVHGIKLHAHLDEGKEVKQPQPTTGAHALPDLPQKLKVF